MYRLLKSIYGLKQGSKNWYDTLHKALLELGFTRSKANHGVFFKRIGKDIIILAIHIDDGMVTGNVSWYSKKQELVTLSTMEVEYVATAHTA